MKAKSVTNIVNVIIVCMLVGLGGFMFLQPGVTSVSISNVKNVYYSGNTAKNDVSLMVNVYWGTEYLDSMLSTLKQFNVSTTFFVGGIWVKKYPDALQKISQAGHEIGNHGYMHREHSKLNYEANQEEILHTHNLVKQVLKIDMNLFAPPSGDYCDITVQSATSLGYKTIMWTRDTIDWRDHDENIIYERAIKNMSNGDLILMHPTEATSKALPRILEYCEQNGYNVTTVSDNLR